MSSKTPISGFGNSGSDIQSGVPREKLVIRAETFNNGFDDLVVTNGGEWLDGMENKLDNTNGQESLPENHSPLGRKFSPDKIKGNRFFIQTL